MILVQRDSGTKNTEKIVVIAVFIDYIYSNFQCGQTKISFEHIGCHNFYVGLRLNAVNNPTLTYF